MHRQRGVRLPVVPYDVAASGGRYRDRPVNLDRCPARRGHQIEVGIAVRAARIQVRLRADRRRPLGRAECRAGGRWHDRRGGREHVDALVRREHRIVVAVEHLDRPLQRRAADGRTADHGDLDLERSPDGQWPEIRVGRVGRWRPEVTGAVRASAARQRLRALAERELADIVVVAPNRIRAADRERGRGGELEVDVGPLSATGIPERCNDDMDVVQRARRWLGALRITVETDVRACAELLIRRALDDAGAVDDVRIPNRSVEPARCGLGHDRGYCLDRDDRSARERERYEEGSASVTTAHSSHTARPPPHLQG